MFSRQGFVPIPVSDDGWARLALNLKAEIDQDLIESYCGTVSLLFTSGKHGRAGIKIVVHCGIESLKLVEMQ